MTPAANTTTDGPIRALSASAGFFKCEKHTPHRKNPALALRALIKPRRMGHPAHPPKAQGRRGFSLLETTIALGILGVGLVMVAAMFPIALTEHRMSADTSRALEMVSRAEAMLHNRLDARLLWVDLNLLITDGVDSPWNLLPFANVNVGGNLADRTIYTAQLNSRSTLPAFSEVQLFGADVLSDRVSPLTDAEAQSAPNRLMWYGFYRQLADGSKSFAVAVCKQRRRQMFFMQDFSVADPTLNPTALVSVPQRFPVPWRVTVSRLPGTNDLFSFGGVGLADLAPRGAKIMIQGGTAGDAFPFPTAPTGRILTVVDSIGANRIRVLEDLSDIASNDPANTGDNNVNFDLWIFPPAASGAGFGPNSPVLEWKVSL